MARTDLKKLAKLIEHEVSLHDASGNFKASGTLRYIPSGVASSAYSIEEYQFSSQEVKEVSIVRDNEGIINVRTWLDQRQNAGVFT